MDLQGVTISEEPNEGSDTIRTSIDFVVPENVENIEIVGTLDADATGNSLDNFILGNGSANTLLGLAGNDYLDGGAEADILIGGIGDDVFVVDNASDSVLEMSDEVMTEYFHRSIGRNFLTTTLKKFG